tara:strand:- start:151 stop:378 length:228 start_codon:yes stop_codon:yes gene_type:complete
MAANKYWIANNPNGEVTDAQVVALKSLSTADLDELDALAAALPMAAIADAATEAECLTKFNTLLAQMRTAGLLTV